MRAAPQALIRVIVVDGQPLFRDALARAIRQDSDLQLAAEMADGGAAIEAIRRLRPDVAIVEADNGGQKLLAAVVREELPTSVLLLASGARQDVAFDAVAAGALGFLSKRVSADAVRAAVRRVAAGEAALCDDLQTAITREVRQRHGDDRRLLSRRERDVLALIADGLSIRDIAARLHLAPATVKTHTLEIYERLGVSERAHAVAEAMRRGLLE